MGITGALIVVFAAAVNDWCVLNTRIDPSDPSVPPDISQAPLVLQVYGGFFVLGSYALTLIGAALMWSSWGFLWALGGVVYFLFISVRLTAPILRGLRLAIPAAVRNRDPQTEMLQILSLDMGHDYVESALSVWMNRRPETFRIRELCTAGGRPTDVEIRHLMIEKVGDGHLKLIADVTVEETVASGGERESRGQVVVLIDRETAECTVERVVHQSD